MKYDVLVVLISNRITHTSHIIHYTFSLAFFIGLEMSFKKQGIENNAPYLPVRMINTLIDRNTNKNIFRPH